MEFKLNEYHLNLSDDNLLKDLVSVANSLHKDTISRSNYSHYGKYHSSTIEQRFGSWQKALHKAGLKSYYESNSCCLSLKEFIEDVIRVAEELGIKTLTIGEYKRLGKFHYLYPYNHYGVNWNIILKMAGLESTPFRLGHGKEITNEELFADIERVWIKIGRQPTITDLKKGYFEFSQNTFCRRFGGWRKTLIAFVDYINSNKDKETNVAKNICEETIEEKYPIHQKGSREPNLRLRFKVMQRDNFKCCICGRSPSTDPSVILVIDHIYPWAKGGETTYENLQTLCSECNLGKSDLT